MLNNYILNAEFAEVLRRESQSIIIFVPKKLRSLLTNTSTKNRSRLC